MTATGWTLTTRTGRLSEGRVATLLDDLELTAEDDVAATLLIYLDAR